MAPVLALVALACAPTGSGPSPVVAGPDFFDRPFPSEDRTTAGHPDLSGFPLQEEIPLLQRYTDQAVNIDGFGLASPSGSSSMAPSTSRAPRSQRVHHGRCVDVLVDITLIRSAVAAFPSRTPSTTNPRSAGPTTSSRSNPSGVCRCAQRPGTPSSSRPPSPVAAGLDGTARPHA